MLTFKSSQRHALAACVAATSVFGIAGLAAGQADRVSGTEKGSVLIFSKIEIRWSDTGDVLQDTFVDLANDFGGSVAVNMYFINGDPPLAATADERSHTGWNWVDVNRTWTPNQPAYWSALTGAPGPDGSAVSPFTILDPSADPMMQGRPADDGSGDRWLRGYIIAFAVDEDSCPISWNHLKGDVTIVNYAKSSAWEYNAWAFQDAYDLTPGTPIGECGELRFDGSMYVRPYAQLLLDFYAPTPELDTSLTLHPVDADLRQETQGPISTKASFVIWNEDETQFTNLHRCITCWDQRLLSIYTEGGVQNHFLSLQTDKGKARIDGIASQLCSSNCCYDRGSAAGCQNFECQEQVCQIDPLCCNGAAGGWDLQCAQIAVDVCEVCDSLQADTPLLGLAAKHIDFGAGTYDDAGTNLIGMGVESTTIYYDPVTGGGNPPTATGGVKLQPAGPVGNAVPDGDLGDGSPAQPAGRTPSPKAAGVLQ